MKQKDSQIQIHGSVKVLRSMYKNEIRSIKAKALHYIRECVNKGLTHEEIARIVDMSRPAIQKYIAKGRINKIDNADLIFNQLRRFLQ